MRSPVEILAATLVGHDPDRADLLRVARSAQAEANYRAIRGEVALAEELYEIERLALEMADLKRQSLTEEKP